MIDEQETHQQLDDLIEQVGLLEKRVERLEEQVRRLRARYGWGIGVTG